MKQYRHCLISSIRRGSNLWYIVREVRKLLDRASITYRTPSLHEHVSLITPFLATSIEAEWLLMGLEIGKSMIPMLTIPAVARTKELDFFSNTDEDALIVTLEITEHFRGVIETIRGHVIHTTDMHTLPESLLVNFHTTIALEKGLLGAVESHGGIARLFKDIDIHTQGDLDYPTLVVKKEGAWLPVVL